MLPFHAQKSETPSWHRQICKNGNDTDMVKSMETYNYSKKPVPRITVAGLRGGSGKTILTLGLIHALFRKGVAVQPFKKGPDYIDAEWMASAAGRQCYNLDQFLMTPKGIIQSFTYRSRGAELAVIEGNRGIFDGMDVEGSCSTAELAKLLGSPVILVVDVTKTTRTAAALVLGCKAMDQDLRIEGIVINRVGGKRHRRIVTESIEKVTDIPVLGAIPRLKQDPLPMRHLGLTPTFEMQKAKKVLSSLASLVEENVDIEKIRDIASRNIRGIEGGSSIDGSQRDLEVEASVPTIFQLKPVPDAENIRIGILRDQAFQFYYPENIEALERAGARIIFMDSIRDTKVPVIHALYFGGGFPETQGRKLEANHEFRAQLSSLIEAGLPVYAECGGLMYLGRSVKWKGGNFSMLGVLDWDFIVKEKPVGHGYSIIEVMDHNPFFPTGKRIKGHEFHYSIPVPAADGNQTAKSGTLSCRVVRGHGFTDKKEGITRKNIFGTYTHIHAMERPDWAESLVSAAIDFKRNHLDKKNGSE